MNITIKQLKIFIGVAKTKSFTKTALQMHLSQSALSMTIHDLEDSVKNRLFERTTRTVELTEAGRTLMPYAQDIINTLERAEIELEKILRKKQTLLRIGFTPFVAGSLAPKALKLFEKQHPDICIEIADKSPEDLMKMVIEEKVDAAYGAFFDKSHGVKKDLICPTHLCLVGKSETKNESEFVKLAKWKSLNQKTLICLPQSNHVQKLIERNIIKHGVEIKNRREVSQVETQIALVEAGYGYALVPSIAQSICERYMVNIFSMSPKVSFDFYCIRTNHSGFSLGIENLSLILKKLMLHGKNC